MKRQDELRKMVEIQAQRMKQAEKDRPTLISQTVYAGTLGILFVLPVVAGAYLGGVTTLTGSGFATGVPSRQWDARQNPAQVAKATVVWAACDVLAPPAKTQSVIINKPSGSIR